KEFALRRMGRATAALSLILILSCAELITASLIVPSLPASFFLATPTLDLLSTPTGTISPELATQIARTPRPVPTLEGAQGCQPGKLMLTAPKAGSEVRATVDVQGTVDIPNFGFYKYEVAPLNSENWSTISAGRETVVSGSLGQWDTTAVPPGDYQLRLVVTDNQGQSLPACIIPVRVLPPS
ncbi:MAG TPA: hypothetical protein VMJ64_10390, partial [Anaerolineales bacterium]|nr:hypothetical protein [Anaerolineales bacterium]